MARDPAEEIRKIVSEFLDECRNLERRVTVLEVKMWFIIAGLGAVCLAIIKIIADSLSRRGS